MELVFPLCRVCNDLPFSCKLLELVIAHRRQIVGIAVGIVEREVVTGEETLLRIVAELDPRRQLSDYKDRCAVGDEFSEDSSREVGVAWIFDCVAVVDSFELVKQ